MEAVPISAIEQGRHGNPALMKKIMPFVFAIIPLLVVVSAHIAVP